MKVISYLITSLSTVSEPFWMVISLFNIFYRPLLRLHDYLMVMFPIITDPFSTVMLFTVEWPEVGL